MGAVKYMPNDTTNGNSESGNNQIVSKISLDTFKDFLAILGGTTALLVALLWYLGRQDRQGYYETLNIPVGQLSFSVWDYGEVAWSYAFLFFALFYFYVFFTIRMVNGLSVTRLLYKTASSNAKRVFFVVILVVSFLILIQNWNIGNKICLLALVINIIFNAVFPETTNYSSTSNRIIEIISFVLVVPTMIILMQSFAYNQGTASGRKYILEKATGVKIGLSDPLIAGVTEKKISIGNKDMALYDDFFLLEYNNGRYFLFRSIDSSSCKPTNVYVIKEEDVRVVEYITAKHLSSPCIPSTITVTTTVTANPSTLSVTTSPITSMPVITYTSTITSSNP